MNLSITLSNKLNWLYNTISFLKTHCGVILGLGLIAGLGRVIQLGGFGEITPATNIVLEVVVESARVLTFLYVLGLGSARSGFDRTKRLFSVRGARTLIWREAFQHLKRQLFSVMLNIIVFMLIAAAINYLIDLLAYQTCLYLTLKKDGILGSASSEWTILLFFKNISVIPFTLVFNAVFLLWITNRFPTSADTITGSK